MMLIHEMIFAAVTMPEPVDQPLLAWISLSALDARIKATIASTIGQMIHETIAKTKAITAFWLDCGTAGTAGAGAIG